MIDALKIDRGSHRPAGLIIKHKSAVSVAWVVREDQTESQAPRSSVRLGLEKMTSRSSGVMRLTQNGRSGRLQLFNGDGVPVALIASKVPPVHAQVAQRGCRSRWNRRDRWALTTCWVPNRVASACRILGDNQSSRSISRALVISAKRG